MALANEVVESINAFGVEFLKQIHSKQENVFFSSVSISTAFAMLLAGTKQQSAEQLAKAFKLDQVDNVHDKFRNVMDILKPTSSTRESYELSVANKLLVSSGYQVLDAYVHVIRDKYSAAVDRVDFVGNGTKVFQDINKWVGGETQGVIKVLFMEPLDPLTKLVIINAIYFKGKWTKTFETQDTRKRTFYGAVEREVDFMYKKDKVRAVEDTEKKLLILELSYIGDASMVIIMPDDKDGLNALLSSSPRDIKALTSTLSKEKPEKAELFLPKFKLETNYELKPILSEMGVKDIFSPSTADLSGIDGTRNLFVSRALHKAVIEVDEEGTKAAAVTASVIRARCLPPPVPVFVVDKPFLFFIRDNASGLNLFTGAVKEL